MSIDVYIEIPYVYRCLYRNTLCLQMSIDVYIDFSYVYRYLQVSIQIIFMSIDVYRHLYMSIQTLIVSIQDQVLSIQKKGFFLMNSIQTVCKVQIELRVSLDLEQNLIVRRKLDILYIEWDRYNHTKKPVKHSIICIQLDL